MHEVHTLSAQLAEKIDIWCEWNRWRCSTKKICLANMGLIHCSHMTRMLHKVCIVRTNRMILWGLTFGYILP